MVWVNTTTKFYHRDASTHYGATKHGKFMTKDEAERAGFKAAKDARPRVKVAKAFAPTTK